MTSSPEMFVQKVKKVPPDGGYGWIIAFANGVNSFFYMAMTSTFGLIYKNAFAEMELSATRISLIVNLYASFGMLTGIFNGVLLKFWGYRKVAFLAALLYFCGLTVASFTRDFILWYGIVASLGLGLCRSAYNLAVITYFKKKRSEAMSFCVTIMGIGSMVIPLFATFLMKYYTPDGVLLILAGISGNFFVTAALLQPVKRHMKEEVVLEKTESQVVPQPKTLLNTIVALFDLDLLKDPIFLNILAGTSLVFFSEINFNALTPFILHEYGLTTDQIAVFISINAFAGLIFRPLAPYIGGHLNKSPRYIYLMTAVSLIVMKFVIVLCKNYYVLLFCAVVLGVSKGLRRVYSTLIIPAHVSLEKLPAASGMGMMTNGLCTLTGGSILGVVRDLTGSYSACIIIMNCVTLTAIIMWCIEGVIVKYRNKETKKEDVNKS